MGAPADTVLAPVGEGERIAVLDVVRGFALLGILLMNVEFFSRPLATLDSGMALGASGLDRWIDWLVHVLVRGKFWTLFSLLFGIGFAVMLSRAEARGAGFAWPYLRRTVVLGVLGIAHFVLLWGGDILFGYAVGALWLLVLQVRRWSPAATGKAGIAIYVLPWLLVLAASGAALLVPTGGAAVSAEARAETAAQAARLEARVAGETAAMRHGDYADAVAWRLDDLARNSSNNVAFSIVVLGVFLVGTWLFRSGIMRDPGAHLPLFRRLAMVGIPLGIGLGLVGATIATTHVPGENDTRFFLATALAMLGNLPASIGYLAAVVLAFHGRWRHRLALLAPAGRMALTNYLLQSLVGILLFHGYGLGLWDMGRGAQVLLVVPLLFAAQVAFSHWWLARFRYGPVEWLWRAATYLRPPPMRRA